MSKLNAAVSALSDALEALESRLEARLSSGATPDAAFEAETARAKALLSEASTELDASVAALRALAIGGER